MRVLAWHVHGAWSTSFVHGPWTTLTPTVPDRGPDGRGRPTTYAWPDRAVEATPEQLAAEGMDLVVLQRPHEAELLQAWTGQRAGRDVPAVYVEHNTPPHGPTTRHPMAEQDRIPIVHVTQFNALMWDNGQAPVHVVEHGIPDPGQRWHGELPHAGVVVNEPLRRNRITGTDLLAPMAQVAPLDVFGIGTEPLTDARAGLGITGHGDLAHDAMLDALAARAVYLHLCRWTSLGLALIEAMHLGMPVVGLATTEAPEALADSGIVLSNDPQRLARAVRTLVHDRDAAATAGQGARQHALARFGLDRFLEDWDRIVKEVAG
jgi:glycosyltransferase involved in cell wall biosynthesis